MSAGRAASGDGDQAAAEDAEQYYLVSPSATTKKRHRPDETGDEPACRAFLKRDDATWRKLSPRQTVFYDDCSNCFPGEAAES
ncbi:hypothetical protein [Halorussus sp. AFM4]|uniref:hypothetical protein n=1 Tax=Halorussus sp. AFM4 TaxID=3421651 RepID=UPI003EB89680